MTPDLAEMKEDDLVKRLKEEAAVLRNADQVLFQSTIPTRDGPSRLLSNALIMSEAATRIEALEAGLKEIADTPRVPDAFRFTGTDARSLENLFDAELRHRSGMAPVDYLKRWLPMFRPFAFATRDDSWGELEKLICTTLQNYVTTLEKCRRAANLLGDRHD